MWVGAEGLIHQRVRPAPYRKGDARPIIAETGRRQAVDCLETNATGGRSRMNDELAREIEAIEQNLRQLAELLDANPPQLWQHVPDGGPIPIMDAERASDRSALQAQARDLCDRYCLLLRSEGLSEEEIEMRIGELLPCRVRWPDLLAPFA